MSGTLTEIPALPVLLPLAAVLMLAAWWRWRRTPSRLIAGLAMAGYVTAVVAVTLLPLQIATGDHANRLPWYEKASLLPVVTIDAVTFVANIVMFLPFGALLPMLTRIATVRQIALASLAASTVIELVQFATNVLVSSGRTADVNDLLANTLGGVLGFVAWRALSVRLVRTRVGRG
ncbi:VanZ family protein [Actinoplanes sp. DH11]|uniref:VanZ family protein n=1 Tax=Actinoplanes sp. DH11 TaxID=2857011 RepID=UPI001E30616E|nr:VanZ family protein [Actinoplanes sp. DH11]